MDEEGKPAVDCPIKRSREKQEIERIPGNDAGIAIWRNGKTT